MKHKPINLYSSSIGQVHHAVLVPNQGPSGGHGQSVAVKI
jgi:predicted unusual protein kinase regulating ubiquinone biosynthesis (AarF/ABC1/UbiB family)